jgi:hypothetical protein
MPWTTNCANCGGAKDAREYANYYCGACDSAQKEAREYAKRENLDEATCARDALARRAHTSNRGRADSRGSYDRIQSGDAERRLAIEPGSFEDPRRG